MLHTELRVKRDSRLGSIDCSTGLLHLTYRPPVRQDIGQDPKGA
jgi:hypothetical protein